MVEYIRKIRISVEIDTNKKTYQKEFEDIEDVGHGEAIFIDNNHRMFRRKVINKPFRPCIFEYIYFRFFRYITKTTAITATPITAAPIPM